jgi:hypothetical protein
VWFLAASPCQQLRRPPNVRIVSVFCFPLFSQQVWQKKFFEITTHYLKYYESEDATDAKHLVRISCVRAHCGAGTHSMG